MLLNNILLHFKRILIKFIYIFVIITFLFCLTYTHVQAAQYTEKYVNSSSLDSNTYPGYSTLIDNLKRAHPNWTFTILYTGLDWNQVIKNETTAVHGRNLIDGGKTGEWICSKCADDKYDNGSWKCASEATVSYYMDPRNSLYEDYIFQFENLKWVDGVYTIDGINKILSDCKYMQGSKITYRTTSGKTATINKSYAKVIYDAAKENKISAYHLAARIRQEQGPGKSASSTATGTYTGYNGYYNFFNINAYGSGSSTIIKNALNHAKSEGWTDPEKSIKGGAKFVADEYINDGQSTLYLQKFDVDNSDGSLYWHQYMQNVAAAKNEGSTILSTYRSIDSKLSQSFNFIIPVYKNMPSTKCEQPGTQSVVTQNIQVTSNNIVVRSSKNTTSSKIATLNRNDKVLRIEIGNTKTNGYYWDKIVLDNGTKGYIISSGIKLLDDITNCNVRAVAIEPGNVRNGPGTSGTTVITTLTVGQSVTIMEKGKYKNINGEDWTRIYLSDGRQGYIVARYLQESSNNNSSSDGKEIVKVVTSSLAVRESPGTDKKVFKYVERGDYLTRTQKRVQEVNGYIWDKVITDDGIEGYVARGEANEDYIVTVTGSNVEIKGRGFKTSGMNVVCEPKITVENIKATVKDTVIRDSNGKEITSGNIGTGYTIKANGSTYTVVKKGDTNGDGKITSADLLAVQRHLIGSSKLNSTYKQNAADANKDNKITSADLLTIKRHLLNISNISI